ncbi:MazG family protein [Frankia sp. AgB32]|uniref:MazG family protein n=1 Tax=Frankia sp. AgB32 TaxID=631119 RepID=UPI00200D8ED1|nr:MazG family protein [Frankia sp. AgB32]MCK9895621.1 MazG family protein [Frankia sp. AgB32]
MPLRITVVRVSPRVAPGVLTAPAWDLLRRVPVLTGAPTHPHLDALRAAGAAVTVVDAGAVTGLDGSAPPAGPARWPGRAPGGAQARRPRATLPDQAVDEIAWLPDPAAPTPLDQVLNRLADADADADASAADSSVHRGDPDTGDLAVGALVATVELPGSALLDAVAVMDRLRSPGGCPWDAEQTHESLAPYLIEETYEAYQAIEDGDVAELREELGDVLMQVLFHARVAAERPDDGWDVDDVAAGLSAKLIRRHPHVFADVVVAGSADVVTNWDAIKSTEKARTSVTDGVPLSQPALSLAAKLLKRAGGVGVPVDLAFAAPAPPATSPAGEGEPGARRGEGAGSDGGVAAAAARLAAFAAEADEALREPAARGEDVLGELLLAAVALARAARVDPEQALRAAARRFRERLAAAERAAQPAGAPPATLPAARWRELWVAATRPGGAVTADR